MARGSCCGHLGCGSLARLTTADMWAALIAAWLDSDRPLRACCPDELGVLTTASTPKTAHHRAHILRVWPTQTAIDAEGLAETVAWQRPRMHRAAEQAPDVFGEATLLGLVEGAVATAALGLLPESLEQAATTLPQAVGDASLIIQPDHTLIAPITLDAGTWELVDAVSHLESWGPVTMHRLDPARLRSAVSGQDPQDLLDRLGQEPRAPRFRSLWSTRCAMRPVPPRSGWCAPLWSRQVRRMPRRSAVWDSTKSRPTCSPRTCRWTWCSAGSPRPESPRTHRHRPNLPNRWTTPGPHQCQMGGP